MSSKSTIFLTDDNIHWYVDCSPTLFKDGETHNFTAVLGFKKSDIEILMDDNEDFIFALKPGSELYNRILKMGK